jgi:hypothetical protein
MNLIQIQDRLKQLPQDQKTMQLLSSYANGANIEVPPYLALAEIQRRNKQEQSAKVPEPPKGTVKDREESEALKQSANLMAAQGAQQQQGIQQLQSALAQGQGEVAPGTPQPDSQPIPEQQQPMPQQPPQQAAEGGIMRLPVKDDMFNFDGGGIVAFAKGDVVDYKSKAAEYLDKQPNLPKTYMDTMEEAKLKNPELAQPAGQATERGIQALRAQDEANAGRFNEREQAAKKQAFWDSLIAAGENSRGQSGAGASDVVGHGGAHVFDDCVHGRWSNWGRSAAGTIARALDWHDGGYPSGLCDLHHSHGAAEQTHDAACDAHARFRHSIQFRFHQALHRVDLEGANPGHAVSDVHGHRARPAGHARLLRGHIFRHRFADVQRLPPGSPGL